MKETLPSIFVSYGLPPMALIDDIYNSSLVNFGRSLEGIKGIVCVSSEWIIPGTIQITANPNPFIQHGFTGFQDELYKLDYKPPFSSDLIESVAQLLGENDYDYMLTPNYGFDHAVWMPLRLIRPEADIPVVQISLPMFEDPRKILKLGHTLSSLRKQGILIMASGQAALNPSKVIWYARGEDVNPKIKEFEEWLTENIMTANIENILDYRKTAPHAEFAHPTTASFLPLIFAVGSSLPGDRPFIVNRSFKYSSSALLSFCLSDTPIPEGTLS